jgi:integrase
MDKEKKEKKKRKHERSDGRLCKNVTIGRNENGSLKRKMIYANTQAELNLKVANLLLQADKGIIIDDKNKTVDVWADEWLETYTTHFKNGTFKNHRNIINKYIKTNFKDIRLKDLKQYQVQNVLNDIDNKDTPRRFLTTINYILDAAVENDFVSKNVAKTLQSPKSEFNKKKPLTDEQINLIKDTDFVLCDICVFLIYSGLRISELINLVWSDIDLKRLTIKIHGDVKTKNSNRIIPIFAPVHEILKAYDKSRIKSTDKEKDYVFLIDGTKCRISELSFLRYKSFDILGFKYTFHQCRHTFATICYNANVDIKQAQEWLGHANFNTTMNIYTHLSEENKTNNTDKINEYLKTV